LAGDGQVGAERPLRNRYGLLDADGGPDEGLKGPSGSTLFMVFEKIGLKFEAQRAAVETFTIEHLERPTGN
jgi:uncharacterized protein (TIGR03435 family)